MDVSDYVGSTAGIISKAKESDKKEFIICTEIGVEYKLKNDNPDKRVYFPTPTPVCADMKSITLEKILYALKTGENQVEIDEQIRLKALKPLDKMLELAK